MDWNDAVKSRLMAYCRIDALEEGEELLLTEVHPIRRQVIPAGRAASSTVTE